MFHTLWSPGMWYFVIGTPILAIFIIGGAAAFGWAMESWLTGLLTGFAGLAIVGVITGFMMWPWQMRYHEYTPVSGIVQQSSSRFINDGQGNISQRIAVKISGQIYGCDDTRCTELKPGDPVTLLCKPEYQWNATPGWACNWGAGRLNK